MFIPCLFHYFSGKDFGNLIRMVVCRLFGHTQHKQKEHRKVLFSSGKKP